MEINLDTGQKPTGVSARFVTVENLTCNHITLIHPSGDERKHRVLGPYERDLLSAEFLESPEVIKARQSGWIMTTPDILPDDGRQAALGDENKLQDVRLEAAAMQFLLFPGENLDNRQAQGKLTGNTLQVQVLAQILWDHIHFAPRTPTGMDDREYLKTVHLHFLENVVKREKMWRNRPGLIAPIEKRIAEIKAL